MSTPQPGDFGLVGSHPGPWWQRLAESAIRFGTDSPVDHAFVYVGDGRIVEAVSRVRISMDTGYPDVIWSSGRLGRLTPDPDQRREIVKAALGYCGEAYNMLDIIAIGLAQRRMGSLVDGDEWWVRRLSDNHRLICSQLVDAAYLAAGIHLFTDGRLPGLVSPGDLLGLLSPATG
jgi:cell wall-associated NlpC family hydrolase